MSRRVIALIVAVVLGAAGTFAALYLRTRAAEPTRPAARPPILQTHRVRPPDAQDREERVEIDQREDQLLKQAHIALDASKPDEALVALGKWRLEIHHSSRVEEADELRVRALVAQGKIDEAKEHVREFDIKHPHSTETEALRKLVNPP